MASSGMYRYATILIAFVSIIFSVLSDTIPSELGDDDLAPSNSPDLDDVKHLFPGAVRFPHRESLWSSSCTGTLIGERLVLTAAHCKVKEGRSAHVWGGHSWESYTVDRVIQHDRYTTSPSGSHKTFSQYDIALVYLTEDVDNAKPLHLNDDEDFPSHGHNLYQLGVTGHFNQTEVSVHPSAIDAVAISSEECIKKVSKGLDKSGVSKIKAAVEDVICLITSTLNKPCVGDSGGGLLAEGDDDSWVVVGVLSNSIQSPNGRCQYPSYPFFDTNVAKFKEWIKDNAGDQVEFETPTAAEKSPEPKSDPFVLRDVQ